MNDVSKPKLSIVIPTFNEQYAIGKVIEDIKRSMRKIKKSYEIVVVDDASTDRTVEIVKRKKVRLVQHPYNRGYGAALKTGIKNSKGDLVAITDGDGTYPVEDIPKLLKHTDEYDMVVGARVGEEVHIPLIRKPGKFILAKLANYLAGTKIPDINSGLRIFKKQIALKFFNLLPSGFSFTTTLTLAHFCNDYTVKYIPINYRRRKGRSKIKIFKDGFNFILLIVKTIMYFSPLKIFLPAAFLVFCAGAAILIYSGLFLPKVLDTSVTVLVLAAAQLAFLGLLADMLVKTRKD